MNRKKAALPLWLAFFPVMLALACQLPSISLNGSPTREVEEVLTWPHSNFVPPRQLIRVRVGEPLALESYHVSRVSRLGELKIWVNGQRLEDEQTGGQPAFPVELAAVQVLRRAEPGQAGPTHLPGSAFPSPACQKLAQAGRAVQRTSLLKNSPEDLEFPASTWTVCHVWIGHKPGTYAINLQVIDEEDNPGNLITQRIEVVEP